MYAYFHAYFFFIFFDPFPGYIFIFRIYLDLFNIFKHIFKTIHHLFYYSVRKRSADALNRVRSQAKLKDATKRIGFLSRYKLLYQSHFLKLFHQKYIKCIWIHFLFKFFIEIIIFEIFMNSVILGWVSLVQIDLVKSQKEVVRIVRKGKSDGKRKKMTIAGLIQRAFL